MLQVQTDPAVKAVFGRYPEQMRTALQQIRELIIQVAEALPEVRELEETLKWGEPSYLTRQGSTLRIDWKEKFPNRYSMFFKCTSKLVPTFRTVFPEKFDYDGNRAIHFKPGQTFDEAALKACISAALQYHRVKHLPLLGL